MPVPGVGRSAAPASPGVGRPHPQPGGGCVSARLRPQLRRLPGRAGGQPAPEAACRHGHAHRHCVQVKACLFNKIGGYRPWKREMEMGRETEMTRKMQMYSEMTDGYGERWRWERL